MNTTAVTANSSPSTSGPYGSRIAGPLIFALTAFPLTLVGQVWRAAEVRNRRLDPLGTESVPARARGRATATLFTLPLTLVTFALGLLILFLTYSGYLYPLRPETFHHLAHPFTPVFGPGTWGGPTLVGAWFIHAMTALGMQVVALAAIRLLGAACRTITRSRIGA